MIRIFLLTFLLLGSIAGFSQSDSLFIPERTSPGAIADFTVDNLGNIYIIYENGQLKKLNEQGDSVGVFNDMRRYGKLHSVDVSNPLKVLLYFKDFGTILILDRFLNSRSAIDLRRLGMFQVKAIGQAYDNGIWVFDEQESLVKRIRDDGTLIDQFSDFRMIFDSMPSPSYISDHHRQLYLYDPAMGLYVFDYFGSFRRRLPFRDWQDITLINNSIFGRKGRILYRYEPGTLDLKELPLPEAFVSARKLLIGANKIYRLDEDAIRIFSFR